MHPPSHTEAANAIAKHAFERNQQFAGCKAISGFIPHEALLAFLGDAYSPKSNLRGKALSADLAKLFQANDLVRYLVTGLLEDISSQQGHPSRDLAIRILDQIQADQAAGPTFRKPLHYVTGTDEGLAIAIAIDDRFWTDEW